MLFTVQYLHYSAILYCTLITNYCIFSQVLKKLGLSGEDVCIQFVEVSEELSGKQQERLCGSITSDKS